MSHLLFHAYLIQHLKLKMHCIMKNCHQQEERFFVFMEQFEVLDKAAVTLSTQARLELEEWLTAKIEPRLIELDQARLQARDMLPYWQQSSSTEE